MVYNNSSFGFFQSFMKDNIFSRLGKSIAVDGQSTAHKKTQEAGHAELQLYESPCILYASSS